MDVASRQRPRPCRRKPRAAGRCAGDGGHRGPPDRAPPRSRAGVLPGRRGRAPAIPRLGDAALRPVLSPSGHHLGTAGHRREAAVPRLRGAGDRGHHRDGADCTARLRRRPSVPDRTRRPPRSRHVPPAPGPGRIRLREPSGRAWRVRGARLAARSLPDGRRRTASHRSARRRDREPPRLRSREPALHGPDRPDRPAPGPRVSDLAGCGDGLQARMAAAVRRRSITMPDVSRSQPGRLAGGHRVLPAAVLREDRDPDGLSPVRRRRRPHRRGPRCGEGVLGGHPGSVREPAPRPRAPRTLPGRDLRSGGGAVLRTGAVSASAAAP